MLQQVIMLIIVICSIFGVATAQQKTVPMPYDDADAYEIYSTLIPSEWPVKEAHAKKLVIQSETASYEMCLVPDKEFEPLIGPAISAFKQLNEKPALLQRKFADNISYKLVTSADINSAFDKTYSWEKFYKLYPDSAGYTMISQVGFNGNKTVAIAYIGHSCGGLCGGGSFHVLQKKDGKWIPLEWKGISCAWAS